MSFLTNLIDKAQGWLAKPKPTPKATTAVVQDRFDQALYGELLTEVPALTELVHDLNTKYDYTHELVGDVFAEFFQADPRLRPATEMDERYLANHAVTASVAAAPETVETRAMTRHDRYSATMATLSVGETVRGYLAERKELTEKAKEVKEAQQGLNQENKGLQEAADAAVAADADLDAAMGDFDGTGPLTQDQAQAKDAADDTAAALGMALQRVLDSEATAEQAQEAAQDAAAQAQQDLRTPVRRAVKEATEALQEEQELLAAWGVDDGDLARMDFNERKALAWRLRHNRLSKFVQLLGRFRIMAAAQRAKKVEYGRDEVVGVELSDRLRDLVPTELVYLASKNRHLRRDFYIRLLEGRVLTRKFQGTEQTGKGAIIACVDCSGSMNNPDGHGITREAWAKAFAFALLDQARTSRRDFVGILFSSSHQMQTYRFPKGIASIDQVLAFVELFFRGGTDFERPLTEATDILEAEYNQTGRAKGDIVFITDDECRVSPEWTREFQARKAKLGFRVFGVAVGMAQAGGVLTSLSDHTSAIQEFVDPSVVGDLMRVI